MKLSVKWLAGLAILVFSVVAYAGLSTSTGVSAAADGGVYVTNESSTLTTESSPPTGRKYSANVYSTYANTGVRNIGANYDWMIVTVTDSDLNTTSTVSDNGPSTSKFTGIATPSGVIQSSGFNLGLDADMGGSCTGAAAFVATAAAHACVVTNQSGVIIITGTITGTDDFSVGEKLSIQLKDQSTKVNVGAVSDFSLLATGSSSALSGIQVDAITFNGDGTNAPIIQVSKNAANVTFNDGVNDIVYTGLVDITFKESAKNTALVTMKSVVASTAVTIPLVETGYNTGRFDNKIWLRQHDTTKGIIAANSAWNPNGGVNCATLANCVVTTSETAVQNLPVINGPVTITYTDAATKSGSTNVARTASMKIDTTVPTADITAPTNKAELQTRTPSFAGSLADTESGIDVSTFELHVDKAEDDTTATNYKDVIGATGTVKAAGNKANVNVTTWVDGVTSKSWTYNYPDALPTDLTAGVTVNDTVDFQVQVRDMAGNYGYSDSDTATTNVDGVFAKYAPHYVKIDQVIPTLSSAITGKEYDSTLKKDKANSKSVKVTFDGNVDADTVAASDFSITLDTGGAKVPTAASVNNADVYLTLEGTIPSNDTPKVTIVGSISDKAGNVTDSGSIAGATDGIPPVLTITTGTGSGLGAAGEATGPESLTKNKMTVTIVADESLNGNPSVWVTEQGYDGGANTDPIQNNYTAGEGGTAATGSGGGSGVATAKGGNTYSIVLDNTNSSGTSTESRKMAIRVLATDLASNETTAGGDTKTSTYVYTLDSKVGDAAMSPATTTQDRPYIQFDFAASGTAAEDRESTALTITSATVDAGADGVDLVDIAADLVSSANGITWFYRPSEALATGKHKFVIKTKDSAGNTDTDTLTVTKSARTDFKMTLYAGWNLISVPSDPVDTAIANVFSNTGIKQVVTYSATTPKQPWRIASQAEGVWTSQTTPKLENITAGAGYWVESSDFEDQTVALSGPSGAGDVRPALITIPVVAGWNLIGVVDQDKIQTQKSDFGTQLAVNIDGSSTNQDLFDYIAGTTVTKGYKYLAASAEFDGLNLADNQTNATIGDGLWLYVKAQSDGSTPDIVP